MTAQHLPKTRRAARRRAADQPATGDTHSAQHPLLDLQAQVGNAGVSRILAEQPAMARSPIVAQQIRRLVAYNDTSTGARPRPFADPEQAGGVLPFTETGWDGTAIGRKLTQLNPAAPRDDNVRCAETSFLVGVILRGPGAVRDMIENYLRRYRLGIAQASTPARIKSWYKRSIRNLTPMLERVDNQTMTFEDLSALLTEMYDVYGDNAGGGGTEFVAELSMGRREGYKTTALNVTNVTREQAAAQAKDLLPGEMLLCGVEVDQKGTGEVGHRIHIGRNPESGKLYLYDPWPVKGDQLIECGDDLAELDHYFTNTTDLEDEVGEDEEDDGMEIQVIQQRTFTIDAKFSPPQETEAAE